MARPARRLIAGCVVMALTAAGCGGPIRPDELRRGVQSLGSIAAEGALVADGVARDRTRSTFTRVQARTLGEEATHEAEKLADATPSAGLVHDKADAVALARAIADALGDLQVTPGDDVAARGTVAALRRLSHRADRLGRRL